MGQDFANEAMVEVPEIVDAKTGHGKAFRQMCAHRFDSLAQPRAELEHGRTVRARHPFAGRRDHHDAVPLGQQRLTEGIDKALIGKDPARKTLDQVIQQPNVMGPGGQQRKVDNHPTTRDAQAQFEAIVIQLFGGTVPVVRPRFETAVPPTVGVATDGQGQSINDLHRVGGVPADLGQPRLNGRFHLPKVGRLADKQRALGERGHQKPGEAAHNRDLGM